LKTTRYCAKFYQNWNIFSYYTVLKTTISHRSAKTLRISKDIKNPDSAATVY